MKFGETFPHQVIIADKPALYADISDAELYAIGKMTTSWAILEHSMMFAAIQLAKQYKPPTVKDFAALSIVQKLLKLIPPATRMAATIRAIRSDTRVLLMSGFNEQEAIARFTGKGLAGFIQKPFTVVALREKLQEIFT